MNKTTVVVGAGIAGLLLARRLQEAGCDVLVLEKSRGYGGRMATKRVGPAVFDQGAQYFTAKDQRFAVLVEDWRARGLVVPWTAGGHRRFVGRPGMTSVPKALAEGLRVLREHKVTAARRHDCDCWELDVEGHGMVRAERLLLTAPLPQSLAILSAGGVALPPGLAGELEGIRYDPCLALLLTLDGPSGLPEEGVAIAHGPVRWLADNATKGVSPVAGSVTVHAGPEFSTRHYAAAESEVSGRLLPEVAGLLKSRPTATTLHRWRYCEPSTVHPASMVWLPELSLGFAGDAFGGPRVEGAALSGLALAGEVVKVLKSS